MALTREQILQADDLGKLELEVPEWGGTIYIKTFTALEREKLEKISDSKNGDIRARFALIAVVDETGKPLFTEGDIPLLLAKSGRALERVFVTALKFNAVTKEDIEEMRGNSQQTT